MLSAAVTRVRGSRRRSLGFREAVDGYLFILPWIVGFILFTAGPMVASVVFSFTKYQVLTPPEWLGLHNYLALPDDPLFWTSLANTAYHVFLGVPIRLAVALAVAMALDRQIRGVAVYRTLYYLPTVVPAVANALLWMWVFNPDYGMVNTLLGYLGIPPQKWLWDVNLAKPTIILLSVWHFGSQMVIFLAGLQNIPLALYEAAQIDGANRWHLFRHVTIPMLSPVVFFNLIIGIITAFQVFSTAYIATAGGPRNATLYYVLYLYRNAFNYFKMGYASALAWVLFWIILGFTAIQSYFSKRWVYYETE